VRERLRGAALQGGRYWGERIARVGRLWPAHEAKSPRRGQALDLETKPTVAEESQRWLLTSQDKCALKVEECAVTWITLVREVGEVTQLSHAPK
jgi:hypothetical protein